MDPLLVEAREFLASAPNLVVFTGAGVSAESGIATFRDAGGAWTRFRPAELASPEGFARDPARVWGWYRERRAAVLRAEPNAAHRAITRLLLGRSDVHLVTQNVDGLHGRALAEADSPSPIPPGMERRILELHGRLLGDRCSACPWQSAPNPGRPPAPVPSDAPLPRCPSCGALLRPDVVWFGEQLDPDTLDRALDLGRRATCCLVVGTSALVYPAASVPLLTLEAGGVVIEVNPEETPFTPGAWRSFRGAAALLLPELLEHPPGLAGGS